MNAPAIEVGILTISDRAAAGTYQDESGPALERAVTSRGWTLNATCVVPDDEERIQTAIGELIKTGSCTLVLTTGGTGITPRDVTPEAVRAIASKELPGFGELMRTESHKINRHAMLSRNLAAVVGRTLVVCLPGSPKAAVECLSFVAGAIPHAIALINEEPTEH
ncbi:MAG: MogA/MoaB family molybdenum cofactor biosynthesis protein [Verrucomicrobia bacterium]|nr:MogA/MoaB family molybdenum cofactor biosynthesis protein [Verrucomicrobiota bacterium]